MPGGCLITPSGRVFLKKNLNWSKLEYLTACILVYVTDRGSKAQMLLVFSYVMVLSLRFQTQLFSYPCLVLREMSLVELKSKYRKVSSVDKISKGWQEEYDSSSKQVNALAR